MWRPGLERGQAKIFREALAELRAAPSSVEVQQHWCNGTVTERFHSPSMYCVMLDDGRTIDVADDDDCVQDGLSDETGAGGQDNTGTDDSAKKWQRPRARTVEEALTEGSWTVMQGGKHIKLRRTTKDSNGEGRTQTATLACTPSDHRSRKNALALLRRMDTELVEYQNGDGDGHFEALR